MFRSTSDSKHPWKHLEADFQLIKSFYVEGHDVTPIERERAIQRIAAAVTASAQQKLARMGVRNSSTEKDDVAQNFMIAMLSGGLARCDGRPLHVFLYATLRFTCLATRRKESKVRFLSHEFDQLALEPGPLDSVLSGEICAARDEMLGALPANRRAAVESWLDRQATGQRNGDRRNRRRQASLFFYSCRWLKKRFPRYRDLLN